MSQLACQGLSNLNQIPQNESIRNIKKALYCKSCAIVIHRDSWGEPIATWLLGWGLDI